jgi:hypothetical protein
MKPDQVEEVLSARFPSLGASENVRLDVEFASLVQVISVEWDRLRKDLQKKITTIERNLRNRGFNIGLRLECPFPYDSDEE